MTLNPQDALTAHAIVAMSEQWRDHLIAEQEAELLTRLRAKCQSIVGLVARDGLLALNRAQIAGAHIASAALDLPEEQAIKFLPLACVPESFEHWMDLHRYFDSVWNETARFATPEDKETK